MPRVHLLPHPDLCPQGLDIEIKPGEGLLKAGVAIEHASEMVAARSNDTGGGQGGDVVNAFSTSAMPALASLVGLEPSTRALVRFR